MNSGKIKKVLTLGAELELQILDKEKKILVPRAPEFLSNSTNPRLYKELFQSMLEIVTGICNTPEEVEDDLENSLIEIKNFAAAQNMLLCSTGTHPLADYNERIITDAPRYRKLIDRNQWLSRRTAVYGLHVHLGMRSGDECIAFSNFFVSRLPMLIALSASSPFWNGRDSGLATTRPTVYEAIPTCGTPMLFNNWQEFSGRYEHLVRLQSIDSMKDLWWDIRPSPGFGTLEIRICDGPATMQELRALTSFAWLLGLWYENNRNEYEKSNPLKPESWILKENKWQSIRHGLNGNFVRTKDLENISLKAEIAYWLELISPFIREKQQEEEMKTIQQIVQFGSSSERQKSTFQKTGSLMEVVDLNIREFYSGKPEWIKE